MILTCPSCSTRYAVGAASIGDGREVRCAKCAYRWFQIGEVPTAPASAPEALPMTPPPERTAPIPPGSGLPAPLVKRHAPQGLVFGAAFLFLLALVASFLLFQSFFLAHMPFTASLYHAVGLYDTSGLRLEEIKVTHALVEGRDSYSVGGVVKNRSAQEKYLPIIRIALVATDGKLYRYWDFPQGGKPIAPNESLPFLADQLEAKTKEIGSVTVELGNRMQLMMRQ